MHRFRLSSATIASYSPDGFKTADRLKQEAIIIPAGAEIVSLDPIDVRRGFDRSKLIEVQWDGKTVRMFLQDLLQRGEAIDGAGG